MVGVAKNLNVRVTLTLEKKTATKVVRWRKRFSIERLCNDYRTTIKRLLRNYQTTFPLRCGNFILTATVLKNTRDGISHLKLASKIVH